MQDVEIVDLFKSPVYFTSLNLDNEKISKYCYQIKKKDNTGRVVSNRGGYQSNDLEGSHPPLNNLFLEIEKHLNLFKIKLDVKDDYNIKISNIWINISKSSNDNLAHNHPDSFLSGVYYVKTNDKSGNIWFSNPHKNVCYDWRPFLFNNNAQEHTIANTLWTMKSTVGKLILFPGWLEHSVDCNKSNQDRISISFNSSLYK